MAGAARASADARATHGLGHPRRDSGASARGGGWLTCLDVSSGQLWSSAALTALDAPPDRDFREDWSRNGGSSLYLDERTAESLTFLRKTT